MKIRSITLMTACVALGGLILAGCQANAASRASSSVTTTPATNAANAAHAAGVDAQSATSAAAGSSTTASSQSQSGSSGYSTCQASGLKISLSGQNTISSQIVQWVRLTNATTTPCTMDGFAGVNLVGSASGQSNYSWSLDRDGESYSTITVDAGESAYFGIKYLPWAAGDSAPINVADIVLTPPNTTTSVTLPWSASVLLQDAATHPGTYLTPVALGING
jgi:hypothetical protein